MKYFTLLVCTLVASAAGAQDARYSFKERFELSGSPQISVSSSDGDIEVVNIEGSNTDVFFIVRRHGKMIDITREALEKELNLTVEQSGSSLNITVKYPTSLSGNWTNKLTVSFRIQTPSSSSCNLRTSDGNISVTGLGRDQKMRTSDGDIVAERIGGAVTAATSDGNITVTDAQGFVEAKTSDGNVRVRGALNGVNASTSDGNVSIVKSKGNLEAKTSDGDVNVEEVEGSLLASTSDGNIGGSISKLAGQLNARTSDGNISLTIPANLGLDLDVKGESLDIPLTNFTGKSDKKRILGQTNGGGIAVVLSTSGNVALRYN